MSELCQAISVSTGKPCQQPRRWLERAPTQRELNLEVCQGHGRALERRGWTFVRELEPIPGIPERTT